TPAIYTLSLHDALPISSRFKSNLLSLISILKTSPKESFLSSGKKCPKFKSKEFSFFSSFLTTEKFKSTICQLSNLIFIFKRQKALSHYQKPLHYYQKNLNNKIPDQQLQMIDYLYKYRH